MVVRIEGNRLVQAVGDPSALQGLEHLCGFSHIRRML